MGGEGLTYNRSGVWPQAYQRGNQLWPQWQGWFPYGWSPHYSGWQPQRQQASNQQSFVEERPAMGQPYTMFDYYINRSPYYFRPMW